MGSERKGHLLNASRRGIQHSPGGETVPRLPRCPALLKNIDPKGVSTCRIFGKHSYYIKGFDITNHFLNCHLKIGFQFRSF